MTVLLVAETQTETETEKDRERDRQSDGVAKCENHRVNQYEKRALAKEAIKKKQKRSTARNTKFTQNQKAIRERKA